jgi:hypothetical protein
MSTPPTISDPGPRIFRWAGLVTATWLILDGIAELAGLASPSSRAWSSWVTVAIGAALLVYVFLETRKSKP